MIEEKNILSIFKVNNAKDKWKSIKSSIDYYITTHNVNKIISSNCAKNFQTRPINFKKNNKNINFNFLGSNHFNYL